MKKILGILVLGLLWCNQSFALTEVDKYAYKKVYDDYYTCTVYFKFLSRGVERSDNLTDKQKNFANKMKFKSNALDMDGRELVEFLNKETDSNITNEDIQKKVENIYVSFLDIAGRDYSKTGLLNDKYIIICNDLLDNSDSRFEYWKQVYNSEGKSSENETGVFTGGEELSDEEMQNMLTEVVKLAHGYKYVDNGGNVWRWSAPHKMFLPLEKWETLPSSKDLKESTDLSNLEGVNFIGKATCIGFEGKTVPCTESSITNFFNLNLKQNRFVKFEDIELPEESIVRSKKKKVVSDNLSGKQLYCKGSAQHYGVQFKRNNNVKVFGHGDDDDWISASGKYSTKPDTIFIDAKYKGKTRTFKINRKTLEDEGGTLCELFPSNINLEKKLKKIFNETMDKKKEDNKI